MTSINAGPADENGGSREPTPKHVCDEACGITADPNCPLWQQQERQKALVEWRKQCEEYRRESQRRERRQ